MTRTHTKFEYHDSLLMDAEWIADRELKLYVELNGHWNEGSDVVVGIVFLSVRNAECVDRTLRDFVNRSVRHKGIVEIDGVGRSSDGFWVSTDFGTLVIDAGGFSE